MRRRIAWCSWLCVMAACFAPWTEVTTFQNQTLTFGLWNEYTGGGIYLLVCAVGAGVGLLARRRGLTLAGAMLALALGLLLAYDAPGTLLQLGDQAQLTWGAFMALAGSFALVLVGGSVRKSERISAGPTN